MQVWTVIFLLDSVQPQRVMMLKRAPWKPFAPDMYTGIGGKEENGEGPLACALRELEEETGLTNIALTEFARCVLDGQKSLHYYRGIYPQPNPPACNEGTLEWVALNNVLSLPIIPTTCEVVKIWQQRQFKLDGHFTVIEKSVGQHESYSLVEVVSVQSDDRDGA